MVSLGERLREERERLGMSQTQFGDLAHVTKKSQMLYEADQRSPKGDYFTAIASQGVDVQYVLTGNRSVSSGVEPLEIHGDRSAPIDVEQLIHIAVQLEVVAKEAGKSLPTAKLIEIAADVYNYFQHEEGVTDVDKLNRTLKLVVNR